MAQFDSFGDLVRSAKQLFKDNAGTRVPVGEDHTEPYTLIYAAADAVNEIKNLPEGQQLPTARLLFNWAIDFRLSPRFVVEENENWLEWLLEVLYKLLKQRLEDTQPEMVAESQRREDAG